MHRRSFLLAAVAVPSLVAALAACGDPTVESGATTAPSSPSTAAASVPATGAIAYPTGADDVVVRVAQVGGFVPAGVSFAQVPDLLITGDGQLFQPGVTTMQYPGQLLPAITLGTITPTGIERLLAVADEHQLLSSPPPEYAANTQVADAPTTEVELHAGGVDVTHQAYGLGFVPDGQGDPAKELTPERARLLTFVNATRDLAATVGADQLGPSEPWTPAAYRIQARPADPATVDTTGGSPGPTIVAWPAGTGVRLAEAAECVIGAGDELTAALGSATTLTFFTEDGVTYQVSAVGQLPGTGC